MTDNVSDVEADLPRAFGSYTLLALLGQGGMGEVFLAARGGIEGISRRCVVKTLRPGFSDDREYVTRFLDEARVVAQLHHRNICPVFDVGKVAAPAGERGPDKYFLAMEYIAGRDLKTVADRAQKAGRPLTTPLALHVVAEVLDALDYAHALTDPVSGEELLLVHRDVSPHNVMVGFDGDVRLIDFGLAASTLKVEQTAPNVVMGKVAYMAPEHICGDAIDARADQYAAAVMAVELLLGARFYEGKSMRELYALAAPGGHRPAGFARLPPELGAILERALAANPDARFPSCGALREALDAWRFAHHPRGEGPALKDLMRVAFVDDIAAERALLARAAARAGVPTNHVVTSSVPSLTALSGAGRREDTDREVAERTVRELAAADVTRHTQSASVAAAAFALPPNTLTTSASSAPATSATSATPTAALTAASARWRMPLVIGAGLLAAVALVIVVARPWSSGTTPEPTLPTTTMTAPPVTTTMTAPPVTTTMTAPPVTTPPVTAPVPLEPLAPVLKHGPRPRPPTTTTTTTPPTTTTTPTPTTPKPPTVTAPPGVRLNWVLEQCATLPCTAPLKAHARDWATLDGEAQASFQGDLKACFLRCTR